MRGPRRLTRRRLVQSGAGAVALLAAPRAIADVGKPEKTKLTLGLAVPAAFGTLLAGLVIWGLVLLLSLTGPFVLQQFLDFATWCEYRKVG